MPEPLAPETKQIYQLTEKPVGIAHADQFAIDQGSTNLTYKVLASDILDYIDDNAQIMQAQVTGLTTSSTPTFAGLNLNGTQVASSVLTVHGDTWLGDGNTNVIGELAVSGFFGTQALVQFAGYTTGILHADVTGNLTSSAVNLASADVTGILPGANGGTGIANSGLTITLGGNISTQGKLDLIGEFDTIFNVTANTNVTFPTSGTLATTAATVSTLSGTANQILVNGTSGTPTSGDIILTLPQSIGTSSAVSFSTVSCTNSNGNFEAFSNNAQTTFGTSALANYIRNSSAVVNNWMGYGFLTPAGNIAAALGCQMTAQTATEEGDLVLFARNNSIGLREGARLIGNTNKFTLVNPLDVIYGGTGQTTYINGQLLIGNTTGNTLTKATLTQGTGVTITNGTGSITIAIGQAVATSSDVTFNSVTGSSSSASTFISSTNNSSTSALTNATTNANISLVNISNTNNNWVTLSFGKNDLQLNGILGLQTTSQATGASDFVLFPGNSSGTVTETFRCASTGITSIGQSTPLTISAAGTVTQGVWNGTTVGVGFGGTGSTTTFTTGSVVIAGASGVYTQDTTAGAQFFWDSTNHRLGIGTNSPQNKIEVVFSESATSPFTGNSGGIAIRNSNNTNNNWTQLWFLANDGFISSTISAQITDQTNRYGDLAIYTRSAGTGLSEKVRFLGAGPIKFTSSTNFTANGVVATVLTSLGPTGSNTTVQEWFTFQNASGTTRYVPCF